MILYLLQCNISKTMVLFGHVCRGQRGSWDFGLTEILQVPAY